MNLNIHSPLPERKDWRIGCVGSGFIMSDCHLVAYRKAGFNPVAIAGRTKDNAAKCANEHAIDTVFDSIDKLLDDESIEVLDDLPLHDEGKEAFREVIQFVVDRKV